MVETKDLNNESTRIMAYLIYCFILIKKKFNKKYRHIAMHLEHFAISYI